MKLALSTILLGGALLLPATVLAHKKHIPSKYARKIQRNLRSQFMPYGLDDPEVPMEMQMRMLNKTHQVPPEFMEDPELYTMSTAYLQEANAQPDLRVPQVDQQSANTWREIRHAKASQCGPYVFVESTRRSPDSLCGSLGYLSAGNVELTGPNAACAKKCGYTFHKNKSHCSISCGGGSSSSSDSKSCSNSDGDQSSSSSCEDECKSSSISFDLPKGQWKKNCNGVTLCRFLDCRCCMAPKHLNFDDKCTGVGVNPETLEHQVIFYNTFVAFGGEVIEPRCNVEQEPYLPGVISPTKALLIQGNIPFILIRLRPFTLKSIFLTFTPEDSEMEVGDGADLISVEIIGKRLGNRRTSCHTMWLWKFRPRVFAPKSGFTKIKKLSIKTTDNAPHHIVIDNLSFCA